MFGLAPAVFHFETFRVMKYVVLLLFCLAVSPAMAQQVEYYYGDSRQGIDILWFSTFKNDAGKATPWLFFSRNRSSVDNDDRSAFGSTNAVSYHFKNGLGIVGVGFYGASGFVPKAGVQYVKAKGDFLFFGWAVADLESDGNIDVFGLFRWTPALKKEWKLFAQAELFPVHTPSSGLWNITRRVRLGPKHRTWSGGMMADFNQAGKDTFTRTRNIGAFIRHDF
jgi:hypothetical protein